MARQRNAQSLNSNMRAALAPLGLVILIGGLSQTAWQQSDFSCNAVRLALCLLSSIGLTVWQATHAHPCAQSIVEGLLQLSGGFWPLLLNLTAAAL